MACPGGCLHFYLFGGDLRRWLHLVHAARRGIIFNAKEAAKHYAMAGPLAAFPGQLKQVCAAFFELFNQGEVIGVGWLCGKGWKHYLVQIADFNFSVVGSKENNRLFFAEKTNFHNACE